VLAAAQVKTGRVFDAREDAHHPRFTENPAAAEDEDIGAREHRCRG
jgi:hypothetical protein